MWTRLLAVGLVAHLTAFAPAPLPKRDRGEKADGVALTQIQGLWIVEKLELTRREGQLAADGNYPTKVRIEGDQWSFFNRNDRKPSDYTVTIDSNTNPPQLDIYKSREQAGSPDGTGILWRQGNQMKLMYSWGKTRPTSWENPPAGYWLLTLKRAR
jgi:uncharacterized protein (TIGR03067 family)